MSIIPSLAIFGSIAGQLILGIYLLVQSFLDPIRKNRLLTFSLVYFSLGLIDILFSLSQALKNFNVMPLERYELLRIFWCSYYIFSIFYMLNLSLKKGLLIAAITLITGLLIYKFHWQMATSVSFPMVYWIAAFLHFKEFKKSNGYASCILCTFSFALGISCSIFYLAVQEGILEVIWLGYLHYAILALILVLYGWVNLPRELRGLSPVKIKQSHAYVFFSVVTFFEIVFVFSIFQFYTNPPIVYIVATVSIILATITLQLYHKNQLVIYTGDVTKLLDVRTDSLKKAQIKLAQLTEKQAEKIEVQKNELLLKNDIINRQRRLEMAAQTAGQVAHDIQNILSPICYQLEQMKEMKKKNNFDNIEVTSEKIRTQVNLLLDLNGQLLSLARRGRIEQEIVNVTDIINDLKDNFRPQDLRILSNDPYWIKGSWSQLTRAITNLIKNGIEANNPNLGPVEVNCTSINIEETKKCHLGFLNPGNYVCISIKDHGSGIPNNIIDKIFDPFFSTKSGQKTSGSGLGLSIVVALIDDHKGVLDLDTGPKGTTFSIYLSKVDKNTKDQSTDLSGNETVLVIDDDNSVTNSLDKILSQNRYRVLIANSGQEAIKTMQSEVVDAVILDYHMPGLDGYQTYYALLHISPNIKVIMHSSYISDDEISKLSQIGIKEFIQKPGNPKKIMQTLRSLFNT